MRAQLRVLRDSQFGVFTAAQAGLEYTRQEMRTLVLHGEWVRVFRGVYREDATLRRLHCVSKQRGCR
ncbi:type IV toxin-antitoxin system AbiEi family antitoxin domain-containing protein [Nocardia sp. NPDC049149]|uniref:type IV toxin-antitoxin system AbiEi family antitoxin domain-containing protein n=1 Tax=Nocardia sp. NPDC049149 TaxID=3364315 RepID=UPI00371D7891